MVTYYLFYHDVNGNSLIQFTNELDFHAAALNAKQRGLHPKKLQDYIPKTKLDQMLGGKK